MPWNPFRRESSPAKDKNPDGWKIINTHYEKENAEDLKRRQEEIAQSGLKENYQGDLLGMQVLEGTVSMFDYRNLPPELYERALAHPHAVDNDEKTFWPAGSQPLKVRLLVGRNIKLSSPYVTGRFLKQPVEENGNAFGNLYFSAQVDALNNIRYVFPPGVSEVSARPFELALVALLDQYKSMNQGKDQADHYPLTVLFAHGHVAKTDKKNGPPSHMLAASKTEWYPSRLVLETLLEKYPPPEGKKPPVLLTSCNDDAANPVDFSGTNCFLVYNHGTVGQLHSTTIAIQK